MQALNNKRTLYIVYQGFPVGHESDGNLIFNRIWKPDFQPYPCCSLVQEVEDIPEDAESEEGPLVISSKWSAFCECLRVS